MYVARGKAQGVVAQGEDLLRVSRLDVYLYPALELHENGNNKRAALTLSPP